MAIEKKYFFSNIRLLKQYGLGQDINIEKLARIQSQSDVYQQLSALQKSSLLSAEVVFRLIHNYDDISSALSQLESTCLNTPIFISMLIKRPDLITTVIDYTSVFEEIIDAEEGGLIRITNSDELGLLVDAAHELDAALHYSEPQSSCITANDIFYMKQAKQKGDAIFLKAYAYALADNSVSFVEHMRTAADEFSTSLYGKMVLACSRSDDMYWLPLVRRSYKSPSKQLPKSYQANLADLVTSSKKAINNVIKGIIKQNNLQPELGKFIYSNLAYTDDSNYNAAVNVVDETSSNSLLIHRVENISYEIHNILRDHGVSFLEDMMFAHLHENPDSKISILESNHFTKSEASKAINEIKHYLARHLTVDYLLAPDLDYSGVDPTHEGLFDHHHQLLAQQDERSLFDDESDDEETI